MGEIGARVHDEAFRAMFFAHYRQVVRFVERRVSERSTAEEIASEVFLTAWNRFDSAEITLPWLYKVAQNKVGDHYRRTTRRRAAEDALARLVEEPPSALSAIDALALAEALQRLSTRERHVVLLTYWDGLDATAAAEVLGTTASAIWVTLSRARAKLRQQLTLAPEVTIGTEARHVGDR